MKLHLLLIFIALFVSACCKEEIPIEPIVTGVKKTNTAKIYIHYKAFFQSPEITGFWGNHWTQGNQNPDNTGPDGKRPIASYYYPMTGPYDTRDPLIQEYQLLLMKYCGIDGLIFDWYGSHDVDENIISRDGTNSVVDRLAEVELQFAISYEDSTARKAGIQTGKSDIAAAKEDMTYIRDFYFSRPNYCKIDGFNMLLTSGPYYFKDSLQWTAILNEFPKRPAMLSWWILSYRAGEKNSQGEFSWIDFNPNLTETKKIYTKAYRYKMGAVFNGYHIFNAASHTQGVDSLAYEDGKLLQRTMDISVNNNGRHVQILTWNDYERGTMVEPTLERGFNDLLKIQRWTGVDYGQNELELIYEYYQKRVKHKNDSANSATLRDAYSKLIKLDVETARQIIQSIP